VEGTDLYSFRTKSLEFAAFAADDPARSLSGGIVAVRRYDDATMRPARRGAFWISKSSEGPGPE
jgi:hypothetical protein